MKKLLLLFLTIINMVSYAQTPNWQWGKGANGSTTDLGHSIAVDSNGNSYVTGYFNSPTITFGSTVLTNAKNSGYSADMFVVKYDGSGNIVWAQRFGSIGEDIGCGITIDISGNILVTGGGMNITFGSTLLNGSFVVKFSPAGLVLWAKKLGSYGGVTSANSTITSDINGNIYLAGQFERSSLNFDNITLTNVDSTSSDIFLAKCDSSGNVVWAKSAGGNENDIGKGVAVDAVGNSYLTGKFYSKTVIFGNITLINSDTTGNSGDMFIAKYDAAGNLVWAKSAPGQTNNTEEAEGIAVDIDGNPLVTGSFGPFITFGNITLTNSPMYYATYIVKYNALGNVLWARKSTGPADSYAIAIDRNGNSYITGDIWGSVSFGTFSFPYPSGGHRDIVVVKYSPLGRVIWAKSISGASDEWGTSIDIDANGNSYLIGRFMSPTISFPNNNTITNPDGYNEFFIAKINDSTNVVWPGDADYNYIVDNNDLLPIGLFYSQTGFPRDSISNLWQADYALDWGTDQTNGQDIKHTDSNGDGIIDANDTLAINLNFTLTHGIITNNTNFYERTAPNLFLVPTNSSYTAGDMVDIEIWAGSAANPITNLYGLAFNINYQSSLVQSSSENISYPDSWLGTLGTDALKIAKVDPIINTAFGAITRIDHQNANGYGKIADFRFQLKNSIPLNTIMRFSISGYKANDSVGSSKYFNTQTDSITINFSPTSIKENQYLKEISIAPNPFTNQAILSLTKEYKNSVLKIYDILGKEVRSSNFSGNQIIIERGDLQTGMYFIKVIAESKVVANEKIIVQ